MERAGAGVATEVMRAYPEARRFAVVCGNGANGGDGRIAARVLREAGREAVETDDPAGADVVIDALFGTGFHGAPRPEAAALIERINASGRAGRRGRPPVGRRRLDRRGRRAPPSTPTLTVTFHGAQGRPRRRAGPLPCGPGRRRGHRARARADGDVRATPAILDLVPRRAAHDSKFTAGSLLVVGGAPGMTGAAVPRRDRSAPRRRRLRRARRSVVVPRRRRDACARARQARRRVGDGGRRRSGPTLDERTPSPSAPASGARTRRARSSGAARALRPAGRRRRRRALRAGARSRAPRRSCSRRTRASSRGCSTSKRTGSRRTGSRPRATVPSASAPSLLLKGADTIVAAADGRTIVCDAGPPSLATAGTGDVLTGVVAAFLAKGLDPVDAAAAAAIAHGLAARAAPHQAGLVARTSSPRCRRCSAR